MRVVPLGPACTLPNHAAVLLHGLGDIRLHQPTGAGHAPDLILEFKIEPVLGGEGHVSASASVQFTIHAR